MKNKKTYGRYKQHIFFWAAFLLILFQNVIVYSESAEYYLNKGKNSYSSSKLGEYRYDIAILYFNEAIKIKPDFAEAIFYRALMYGEKNNHEEAIRDYTEAINLGYINAYHNRGIQYAIQGDYDKAIADFSKVIKEQPYNNAAYFKRGHAYNEIGNYKQAIADYMVALKIFPGYYDDISLYLAEAYYNDKQYQQALDIVDKGIEKHSSYEYFVLKAKIYNDLGYNYAAIVNYKTAIDCYVYYKFKDQVKYNPYYNLGCLYFELKKYDDAIKLLSKAVFIVPDFAEAYHMRGMCYEAMGNKTLANEDYKKAQ